MRTCVYCGRSLHRGRNSTRDHVFPKSLFADPRPNDLITVRCCQQCNAGFTKDEDLFLATILAGSASETPQGKRVWTRRLSRALDKDRGLGMALARRAQMVDVVTPGGIYLGRHLAINVDMTRIGAVVSKIVRGLFWFEFRNPMPVDARIKVRMFGEAQDVLPIMKALKRGAKSWPGIAEYWCRKESEEGAESGWLLGFYRTVYFWAYVPPQSPSIDPMASDP